MEGKTYQEWERAMRDGKNGEVVYFKIDKTMYTQVFVNLDVIKDWSVVVRIPNNALSYNLRVFHIAVIVVSVVLIFSLLIIYILSNKSVEAEKQMLEYLSIQDPLTKLENRRSFKNVFDNYLMNRKESSLNGALIFFDIDYFKQVNDGFGHAMGDKVLQEFANITKEIFADNGKVFRYGGDEFILLIQHLESREKIEKQLKELRRRLKELDFLVDKNGKVFQIHFSAGIVEITEQMDSFKIIEKKADKALYQVKQRGRNGFEWYSD